MVFRIGPETILYLISNLPVFPGAIEAAGFDEIVKPEVERTFEIINGASPVLVNSIDLIPVSFFFRDSSVIYCVVCGLELDFLHHSEQNQKLLITTIAIIEAIFFIFIF